MAAEIHSHDTVTSTRQAGLRGALSRMAGRLAHRAGSTLTRRIVLLNLAGLLALLLGYLYLNQFRAGLIESRAQSLLTQGEIIAGAIAASASVENDGIMLDPDKLFQQQAGDSFAAPDENSTLEFSINPERVSPVLRRLITPTKTRARVFDRDGATVVDSARFISRGDITRFELPPPAAHEDTTVIQRTFNLFRNRFGRIGVPLTNDDSSGVPGKQLAEVSNALKGEATSVVRVNQRGETIVSVAVPIQRFRSVRGALLLATQGGDIDAIISQERWALVQIFCVAAAVMLVLSLLLANTIAGPMRKLAAAAENVRRGVKKRIEIPDYTDRRDEIGHLSGSLRDMTQALYKRIEGTERFAADVAHELKNPLTSLRSAVETLPLAKTDDARKRLLAVIQHDVRRLDRLISDISDASRLDAELARSEADPVDVARLVEAVASVANEVRKAGSPRVEIATPTMQAARDACLVNGQDSRLGQVLTNLIENARSFSPPDGAVRVALKRVAREVEISVEDDGPGIPDHALERIFERFYTDRPDQGFGQNSGLGLSISRQIVEAHGGRIWAENRMGPPDETGEPRKLGARFIVRLPAAG
ncbi:stimulus-sensing domain-containing protein [Terrirubrum flagellatum]|uniref:stimulus-sensing domain-containing protein n=1 Tax=Terrirubrum flagellatum TaxID=2895980 RepID=UPI003CC8310A